MHSDPREIINQSDMGRLQYVVVAITMALNALDGFDVMAISFASPGIAEEWGTTPAALGFILSMELLGMAVGSLTLGGMADKYGRRPTILACLLMMTLGMFMATTTTSLEVLSVWRVTTGLGIGGMLAAINAMAAEFSNTRNRQLTIAIMSAGYPLGGVFGGLAVMQLLKVMDWRSVFYFGTAATALMIPIVWFLMPESVHWLVRKRPSNMLERVNSVMARLGHATVAAIPEFPEDSRRSSWVDIFSPTMLRTTLMVTLAYFFHIVTFYYILKWVPKLVVDMGFSPSSASGVLTWATVGGALGAFTFGALSRRFPLKTLTLGMFALSWIATCLFGQASANLAALSALVAMAGYFINAGIVGMFGLCVEVFPTHVRASGTGFVIGVGRGGSALSPILAGFLLQGGLELPSLSIVMGSGSILAALALLTVRLNGEGKGGGQPVKEEKPSAASLQAREA